MSAESGRLMSGARRLVSPRHRRWQALLRSCQLDPGALPDPLPEPGPRDFIICGSPRTGTALLAAQMFQPPKIVTVMEPWDGLRLPPAALFDSLRSEIDRGVLRRGRLDVRALRDRGEVCWVREGHQEASLSVDADALLGVKWPAFWRYLGRLPATKFLVCLRHPASVVASYRNAGGRLAEGLEYDVAFHRNMNHDLLATTDDPVRRRVALFDHISRHVLAHLDDDNVLAVRYERWFDDPERLMEEIAAFLDVDGGLWPGPAGIGGTSPPPPPQEDVEAVARYCRTAERLGYDLSARPR